MDSTKDYSTMTRDELVSEEKKMQSKTTTVTTALVMGFLIGIAFWSATHKGGFLLTVGLLISALLIGSRHSKKLRRIQAEISRRDTLH